MYRQYNAPFQKKDRFRERAGNYKGGITVFGVGLSMQSGASQFVTKRWKFGSAHKTYWLCGE
jgi:hypothetical protein